MLNAIEKLIRSGDMPNVVEFVHSIFLQTRKIGFELT